jgi:hypothetical protein
MSRCTAFTKSSMHRRELRRCKRNCADGTDFCKQHNPVSKLDDVTCAICLDDIKNPLKLSGCRHVFCKTCIADSMFHANFACPCCRAHVGAPAIKECIKFRFGKKVSAQFELNAEIETFPERWYGTRPWTNAMRRRYFAVYPPEAV